MRKEVDRIALIREVAKELDLPARHVAEAISSQFWFAHEVISGGDPDEGRFDAVRLPYIGVFKTNPTRVKKVTERRNRKRERLKQKIKEEQRKHDVYISEQEAERASRDST